MGELVFEGKGKVTGQRVLDIVKGGAKIEASFIRTGKMKGIDVTNTGTLWSIPIEGGAFYGEAKVSSSLLMAKLSPILHKAWGALLVMANCDLPVLIFYMPNPKEN